MMHFQHINNRCFWALQMIQRTSLHTLGWINSNINSNSGVFAQIGEGNAVMMHSHWLSVWELIRWRISWWYCLGDYVHPRGLNGLLRCPPILQCTFFVAVVGHWFVEKSWVCIWFMWIVCFGVWLVGINLYYGVLAFHPFNMHETSWIPSKTVITLP